MFTVDAWKWDATPRGPSVPRACETRKCIANRVRYLPVEHVQVD